MNDILMEISKIQDLIFDFNIKTAMNCIGKLTENLLLLSNELNEDELAYLIEILKCLNTSIDNKDYLLYSDILEYELKTFIENRYTN